MWAQNFSFHNQSSYIDETKLLHLLGELKNESGTPAKNIIIVATFYDENGNLLGEFKRSAELRVINPGELAPFEILYLDQKTSDRVTNFTLSATSQPATANKEKQLKIVSSNSRLDLLGTFYINVLARNEGKEDATNSIMIATLYDKNDRVIAIGRALAEAIPGSSDIPAGSDAAFGIAITEKLQTPKTAKYSLVADSDQYSSDVLLLLPTGPGLSTSFDGNQTQSGCLIATAAFGSELAPQVQQLRTFRDGVAMQTFAGASFMTVFNSWYYSFSPGVAEYERNSPWLRNSVRILVAPLLHILDISTHSYDLLSGTSQNREFSIVVSGLIASSLVGLIYLAPMAVLLGTMKKVRWNGPKVRFTLAFSWLVSLSAIIAAGFASQAEIMMLGSGLLVLSAISTVFVLTGAKVARLQSVLFSRNRLFHEPW